MYVQVKDYQNVLKLKRGPLAFTSYKAFQKTKRSLELVFLTYFCMYF